MKKTEKILVVCRSTSHCSNVFHQGMELALAYGARLFVLHVVHDPFSLEGWNLPIPSIEEDFKKLMDKYRSQIHQMVVTEKEKNGVKIVEWVREGDPVGEIMHVVESEKIDLIVMPSHQEGRLEHLLFGHTNHEILRKMPCSILLVKQ